MLLWASGSSNGRETVQMIGIIAWSATIGYYLYLWKSRKIYEIDRVTLVLCLSLLLVSYVITL